MTSTGAKHHLKYKAKVSYKPAGKSIKVQMILSVQNLKYSDIVFEHLSLPKITCDNLYGAITNKGSNTFTGATTQRFQTQL